MCRHLAWLGAPRQLIELLLEPEHSLLVQSYAPWADVRDHHLVDVTDGVVTVTDLEA